MSNFLILLLTGYLLFNAYLYVTQDKLILYPPAANHYLKNIPQVNRISLVLDNLELTGIQRMDQPLNEPVILYFGGNAEDVVLNYSDFMDKIGINFIAINYRGFAGNPGEATLSQLKADASQVFNLVTKRYQLKAQQMIVMGRSLGSAFAISLSKEYPVLGVIAVSPFDSLAVLGQRHYPFFPVSLLLKENLDNIKLAAQINSPLLVISGQNDKIIPESHSQKVFSAWQNEAKTYISIPAAGHNDIQTFTDYYVEIRKFIETLH